MTTAISLLPDTGLHGPTLESNFRSYRPKTSHFDGTLGIVNIHVLLRIVEDLLGSGTQVCLHVDCLFAADPLHFRSRSLNGALSKLPCRTAIIHMSLISIQMET